MKIIKNYYLVATMQFQVFHAQPHCPASVNIVFVLLTVDESKYLMMHALKEHI